MISLDVMDDNRDHFFVTSDEPVRIEVQLADSGHIIGHVYRGAKVDLDDPVGAYDGTLPWNSDWQDRGDIDERKAEHAQEHGTGDVDTYSLLVPDFQPITVELSDMGIAERLQLAADLAKDADTLDEAGEHGHAESRRLKAYKAAKLSAEDIDEYLEDRWTGNAVRVD